MTAPTFRSVSHKGEIAEGAPTLLPAFAEIDSLRADLAKVTEQRDKYREWADEYRDAYEESQTRIQELSRELAQLKRHIEWELGK